MDLRELFEFKYNEFEKMLDSLRNIGVPIYHVSSINGEVTEVIIVIDADNIEEYGKTKALLLKEVEEDSWKYRVFVVDKEFDRRICILDTIYEIMYTFIY